MFYCPVLARLAPFSRDNLRVILKYAVKWYRSLETNPAEGVTLPKLVAKNKPWALTPQQAGQILSLLEGKPRARAAVWLLIVTGIRRGEYLAFDGKTSMRGGPF